MNIGVELSSIQRKATLRIHTEILLFEGLASHSERNRMSQSRYSFRGIAAGAGLSAEHSAPATKGISPTVYGNKGLQNFTFSLVARNYKWPAIERTLVVALLGLLPLMGRGTCVATSIGPK
jgi:hypothetical protein